MIGEESDSDSGHDAAEQRDQPPVSRPQAQQQKRQRLIPRGDSSHSRKGDSIHASQGAAGGETAAPQRPQFQASLAGQDSAKQDRADSNRAETTPGHEHESEEAHKAEGPLGRKQKRGKKKKPVSQLQRVQAEVQAKKASAGFSPDSEALWRITPTCAYLVSFTVMPNVA